MNKDIPQWNNMVAELEAHPKISVLQFRTFPPVSTTTIKTIEKKWGHSLSTDFSSFFLQTNGLQLRWDFSASSSANPVASIFLPSLESIFASPKLLLSRPSDAYQVYLKKTDDTFAVCMEYEENPPVTVDFPTYLHFLWTSKGLLSERKHFFKNPTAYQAIPLKDAIIHHFFKKSTAKGNDHSRLKTQWMQQKAAQKPSITPSVFQNMVVAHHDFLSSGGVGGRWQTIETRGVVFGVYTGKEGSAGQQAIFEQENLSSRLLGACAVQLPFSNFCGVYAPYQDFSEVDFSYSLCTDADFRQAIFAEANLEHVDFSRSNLRQASFMNANLAHCDFENCDLTGADFRGANWENAQFPGAILDEVLF